jgi:hypothetical protein
MSKLYLITNDKGRSLAYQKAIEAVKRCTHPIRTYEVNQILLFLTHFFVAGNQSITICKTIIS